MDISLFIVAAVAAISTIGLIVLQLRAARINGDLNRKTTEIAELVTRHAAEVTDIREAVVQARTRLESSQETIKELNSTIENLEAEKARLEKTRTDAEKREALAVQKVDETERRMEDWEAAKKQNIEAAKAATLESANILSSKLLEDHKREAEEVKKSSEEEVEKTSEKLQKEFTDVVKSVASLNDQVSKNQDTLGTVWNALTNPAGVGYYSEISLENTLKSFGLQPDLDFHMRRKMAESDTGGKLIPDAVVFLPGNSLLVIDSKASKFFLELADAIDTEDEEQAYQNLANSMRQHLRGLAGKDYQTAIKKDYRQSGRGDEVGRILSIMYLPNEAALEKLSHADSDFSQKAADANIIPAGPVSLSAIIGFASAEIDLGRQAEAFPEALKTDDNRLHGCQSQVWIVTERRGEKLHYAATSDSTIVAGLIAILLTVYSDRRPADILATPPAFIKDLQLAEHLSPTRSNGLHAMVQRVRQFALEAMVEDNQDYAGSPAW